MDSQDSYWLLIDGYEDEPAAFGVPPYIGFHCRYIAGVFEKKKIPYKYITIDQWRIEKNIKLENLAGIVILAGAVVPGKYLRGTPISLKETQKIIGSMPISTPILCGGWAIRGWKQNGWRPLRKNLFMAHWDTDASLNNYLETSKWKHLRRTAEQWDEWAKLGASSKAVLEHPDLNGPLTYEVEVYQGCVRYKNGCKFCLEPKKGVPLWRSPESIISEVKSALDSGVKNIRLGGMTDVYTYLAEGVKELEYPIPNPKPLEKLLYGLREDERLEILHVDNGNPSIIAENIEPSTEITKILVDTLSDGAILNFGADKDISLTHVADTGLTLAGSHANGTNLRLNNSAADGDCTVQFQLGGTTAWSMGVEDGDSDKFVIEDGAGALGADPAFEIAADKSAKLYVYNANAAGDTDYMTIAINTVVLGHVYPGDWCLIPWAAALDVTLTPKANTAVKAEYAILGGE